MIQNSHGSNINTNKLLGLVRLAEKVIKSNLRIISKPHAYLQTMSKTTVKLRTQGTHYLFTLIVKTLKND